MRKHDYGMYMSLGAKSTRIGLLIFCETLLTGLLSVFIGIILGIGLTAIVSQLLINKLGLRAAHFQAVLPAAILGTLIFFTIIFFIGALRNVRKLTHTPIIELLHEGQAPVKLNYHPILRGIEVILGIALLALGYHVMTWPIRKIFILIPTALVTIVAGSYFVFNAVFSSIINFLLKRKSFSYHGIRMFTLGQLKFRLQSYTRVLTVISLLFALALGAITVGLNFNYLKDTAKESIYYDTTIASQSPEVKKAEAKLNITHKQTYHYKEKGPHLYFKRDEFVAQPLKNKTSYFPQGEDSFTKFKVTTLSVPDLDTPETEANNTFSEMMPGGVAKKIHLVSQAKWQALAGQEKSVSFINVKDFERDLPTITQIEKLQVKENSDFKDFPHSPMNKLYIYSTTVGLCSPFEFMGFFLGFAFLTMLASTLMFKVLSDAISDKARYKMLYQMGTHNKLLRRSILTELATLFVMPAALGIADVLFGLQLFRTILPHPYRNIWIPFVIFIVLYLCYYLLTVKLYEKIVLNFEKK